MTRPRYFVILAAMRTGSNLLERTLNQFPGLICHGELFNPAFIGKAGADSFLDMTRAERDRDPLALIDRIVARAEGRVPGFRLFDGHDPRVLARVAADPACARVILTRDPIEVHVSLKIAQETDQWMLGNPKRRRVAQVAFVPEAFEAHQARLEAQAATVARLIRMAGQTAFSIDYRELQDIDILNGLGQHLGATARLDLVAETIHRQNPGPVEEKLTNPEVYRAWAGQGARRVEGPGLPLFACRKSPLLFAPMPGGPRRSVLRWMASLDAGPVPEEIEAAIAAGKVLRTGDVAGATLFTVRRDPLARARALCGPNDLAATLRQRVAERAEGRLHPDWAPQAALLARLAAWRVPDLVLGEDWMPKAAGLLRGLHGIETGRNGLLKQPEEGPAADPAAPEIAGLLAALWPEDVAAGSGGL